jgi:predicted permease
MLRDVRHGIRVLLQAKGWTTVVVLSLALGIGANTALFSAINGLLLKKVTVRDPDTLVRLKYAGRNQMSTSSSDYGVSRPDANGQDVRATFSYPMYQQFVADNKTMTDLFACAPMGRANVAVDGSTDTASAFLVTGNYFRVLEVNANPGRTLLPADDAATVPPAAVISYRYWLSRFGGAADIIGKNITVNNIPVTIVGVISPDFTGVQQAVQEPPDVTLPVSLDPRLNAMEKRLQEPTFWWLQVMGRLKPGATAAQVQDNLGEVFRATARGGLHSYLAGLSAEARGTADNRNRSAIPELRVDTASHGVYDVSRADLRAVSILSGVVVLVLIIVCANVANLLFSRATARTKEVSIRLSLGATRGRLVRQLLTESLLLAAVGGALGLAIGHWGKQLLPGAPGQATTIDWRVIAFVFGVTALTAMVFGIVPALRATGINVNTALKETSRSVVGSRTLLGKALLVLQVAISLVLLVGAGLFLRTVENLRQVDVGFNPRNLVLFRVNPMLNQYDNQRTLALYQQITDRLRSVPGVRAVTSSQPALLSGSVNQSSLFVQGRTYVPNQRDSINRLTVAADFFEVMEMPIVLGRGFTERDNEAAPKVAVINDAAARKYFAGTNPIGQRVGDSVERSGQIEIVGVLRDAKYDSVRDVAPPTLYVPYKQRGMVATSFAVRTAGDPLSVVPSIREAVKQVDPNVPMLNVSTQMEQIEQRLTQEKLFAQAYALFGGVALLLAAVGLFGLMSYSVARRTNEIGIRMALGAERLHVLRMVMGESMALVAIGIVLGIATALAAGRFVTSLLYGVETADGVTMAIAGAVMVVVAAAAGYLPARRASAVDPMVALHEE